MIRRLLELENAYFLVIPMTVYYTNISENTRIITKECQLTI